MWERRPRSRRRRRTRRATPASASPRMSTAKANGSASARRAARAAGEIAKAVGGFTAGTISGASGRQARWAPLDQEDNYYLWIRRWLHGLLLHMHVHVRVGGLRRRLSLARRLAERHDGHRRMDLRVAVERRQVRRRGAVVGMQERDLEGRLRLAGRDDDDLGDAGGGAVDAGQEDGGATLGSRSREAHRPLG